MFGFLIGSACLLGLISTFRRGHCHGSSGWHGGHGGWFACGGPHGRGGERGGPWGYRGEAGPEEHEGHGRWGGGCAEHHGGFGERTMLRAFYERLDTTPGQEKVIARAMAELRKAMSDVRPELKASRADVARAFRADSFDAVLLGELFARHDRHLEEVRKAFVSAMDKIHEALEPNQRERLASLIEEGWFRAPWRSGRCC